MSVSEFLLSDTDLSQIFRIIICQLLVARPGKFSDSVPRPGKFSDSDVADAECQRLIALAERQRIVNCLL
ncbi:MAG: hypothetical protein F6K35_48970 [Okeania sp. SIO2H7]|nr:hypothetical protein [Okeania sp. SIO2H7]